MGRAAVAADLRRRRPAPALRAPHTYDARITLGAPGPRSRRLALAAGGTRAARVPATADASARGTAHELLLPLTAALRR
ncbi:hypothetical protein [Streptomyces olivaceoviridis]|uniref:hypothetical protein n=1 Tax=Streptomyces olivaceoviridis TaxID=1921 RepID=UPI0037A369BB